MNSDPNHLAGQPNSKAIDNKIYASVYTDAARETGKTEDQLATMAWQVFASILFHTINNRGSVIWTAAKLEESGRFSVETNIVPRFRTKPKLT